MRSFRAIFVSVIFSCSLGCGEKEVAIGGIDDIKAAAVAPTSAAKTSPSKLDPPDHSLNTSEYLDAGVPAIDHPWTGIELTETLRVLKSISQSDASRLPRYKSDRSGDVFERITSEENRKPFSDESRSAKDRLSDSITYIDASNQMTNMYFEAAQSQAVGGEEVVELVGSNLQLAKAIVKAIDEYVPTLDKSEAGYEYRMNNLKGIQTALGNMIAASIQLLAEPRTYKSPELKRLIGYQQDCVTVVFPNLSKEAQEEIKTRLDKYSKDGQMSYLNPELEQFVSKINEVAAQQKK